MKTYIIFDTNVLFQRSYNDYSKFTLHPIYYEIRGKIERHDVENHFEILVPEITINELFRHQVESFQEKINSLIDTYKTFKQIYEISFSMNEDFDYEAYLHMVKEQYIKGNGIKLLPICSESRFSAIVSRALNKLAPFDGGEKASDKGFKDAVIWESILEFASKNKGQYIFLTHDKGFREKLKKEFENSTGNLIMIFNKDQLREVDLYIEDYSTEQNIKIKLQMIYEKLQDHFEDFILKLKTEKIKSIEVNKTACLVTEINFKHEIIDLNEVGVENYKFKLKGFLIAEKKGFRVELEIIIDILVSVDPKSFSVMSLKFDGIEGALPSGDLMDVNISPFEYLPDDVEEYVLPDEDDDIPQIESYLTEQKIKEEIHQSPQNDTLGLEKEFIKYLSGERYSNFFNGTNLQGNQQFQTELLETITLNVRPDWDKFPSGVARMRKSLRNLLKQYCVEDINTGELVELVIEQAVRDYRHFIEENEKNLKSYL